MKIIDVLAGGSSAMTPESALRVRQIDHVTLVVADLESTDQFYAGMLGMQRVERPAFSFAGRWYQAGSTQIHATQTHPEAGSPGWADQGATEPSRGHHFAFRVDDAHAAAAAARELGIEIVAGPKRRPDGYVQVYVLDPDRHVVELFSEGEG